MKVPAYASFLVLLVGASSAASAWWDGPGWGGKPASGWGGNDWRNDRFGDGWGDLDRNLSSCWRGWSRASNRRRDWHGYGPYGWGGPWSNPHFGGGFPYAFPHVAPLAPGAPVESD